MQIPPITIDGSYGEGGGQILRTALALSIILSMPIEIINIRKARKIPGLQPQHLTCVNACKDISGAHVEGNEIGSTSLRFNPSGVKCGNFTFNVAEKRGSAGSTSLILQTLLPPLILGPRTIEESGFPLPPSPHPSPLKGEGRREGERDRVRGDLTTHLTIMGGTHVPWSPPFHYLKEIFIPAIEKMGCSVSLSIEKWGWYPIGGGIVHAEINPIIPLPPPLEKGDLISPLLKEGKGGLSGFRIDERGRLLRIYGISAVSNLPLSITERQRAEGLKNLKPLGVDTDIEIVSAPSPGKGTFFFIVAEYERIRAGFSSLGAIGKTSEDVAREACRDFLDYHRSEGALDPHLADQLIPYIALALGPSAFATTKITRHLLTNVWTVRQLMDVDIKVEGEEGEEGKVVR